VCVADSSSDDDSSIMEDDSSRSSSAIPRPLVVGAGSQRSRGSVESHGPTATPRSAPSHSASGGGGKVSDGSGAARAAKPPSGALRDVDAMPPTSQPSCACLHTSLSFILFRLLLLLLYLCVFLCGCVL